MKILNALLASAMLTVGAAGAASATVWADNVEAFTPGTNAGLKDDGDLIQDNFPVDALNAPDSAFYSVGIGGDLTVSFGKTFNAGGGTKVYEITNGDTSQHVETADVFAVILGVGETFIGSINNQGSPNPASLTYNGTFDAIRILDTSTGPGNPPDSWNGYDVDAVGVNPIPLPATGLLLLGGLAGLGAIRRKRG